MVSDAPDEKAEWETETQSIYAEKGSDLFADLLQVIAPRPKGPPTDPGILTVYAADGLEFETYPLSHLYGYFGLVHLTSVGGARLG
jgi:hypothetical protein